MLNVLVYGDSLSWGMVPGERRRLPFNERWPGVMESGLIAGGLAVRVTENCLNGRCTVWEDPFKPGRRGITGVEQVMEIHSPLDLVIVVLGTNDMKSHLPFNNAWAASQGVAAIVGAMRRAPIEPGMLAPRFLIVSPPRTTTPRGMMVEKFAGAKERSRGMAEAYRAVADELGCGFFDAGAVATVSEVDGVHLDAKQHRELGEGISPLVAALLGG